MNAPAAVSWPSLAIDEIEIGDRYRKDLGDLDDLAMSIVENDLIHPIAITSDGRLVAGHRRLEACRRLGWSEVPVRVLTSISDAVGLLLAERDENECREPPKVSEQVAMGLAIEALEKPKAAARKAATQAKPGAGVVGGETVSPPTPEPRVREKVGAALGISGVTYDRARLVVTTANDPDAPEDVRKVASQALAEMDATGKVKGAWRKTLDARDGKLVAPEEPPETPTGRDLTRARAHLRRAHDLAATLRGFVRALEDGTAIDARRVRAASLEESRQIARDLKESLAALRKVQRAIEQESRR